jgi:hypothetical protein
MKDKKKGKFHEELIEFLYGDLPSEREEEIRKHLETCEECREALKRFSSVRKLLGKWDDVEPPYRLVFLASSREPLFASVRSFFSRLSPLARGVSLALIFAAGFLLIASLFNLELTYDKGRFNLSTALIPKAKARALTPEEREAIYQAIVMAQEDTLARVNNILNRQDRARREDLAQAFDNLLVQIEERRRTDISYFGEGLRYLDQRSLLNYRRTKELMDLVKTSAEPPE